MSQQDDKQTTTVAADDKPTVAGAVELQEDTLDQIAGGRKAGESQKEFLKVTLNEVFVS